jgi:hypothetical protein
MFEDNDNDNEDGDTKIRMMKIRMTDRVIRRFVFI